MSATYPEALDGEELRAKLDLEQRLGQRAELLVSSEDFQEVVAEYRGMLMETWAHSEFPDQPLRDAAYHQIRALAEVESRLRERVMTGKLATEQINSIQKKEQQGGDVRS